jgi:hypothetical protein
MLLMSKSWFPSFDFGVTALDKVKNSRKKNFSSELDQGFEPILPIKEFTHNRELSAQSFLELPRVVERPGVEPGLAVLQTAVQTHYTISRNCGNFPAASTAWLRSRELNSALELMRLVVSPTHSAVYGSPDPPPQY